MAAGKHVERSICRDERLERRLGGEIPRGGIATGQLVEWKDCLDRV